MSPLLHKSTANTDNDVRTKKTTVLSLYREVLGVVFKRSHWLLLVLALIFFIMAGATLSSFFILFEQLSEVSMLLMSALFVGETFNCPFAG